MSHSEDESTPGGRIRKLRGDLSVVDFAARLNVDRKSVAGWESNVRLPDGTSLLKLMTEFGADVNYILNGQRSSSTSQEPPLTREEAALLDNFRHADDIGRAAARRVLNVGPQRKTG